MKSILYLAGSLCGFNELIAYGSQQTQLNLNGNVPYRLQRGEKERKGDKKCLGNYSTNHIYLCDFKF